MARSVTQLAKRVRIVLLDVDGVLTDGRIVYDSSGRDMKFFDVHDGLGVHLLKLVGIPAVLVTAKGSGTIAPRAKDMGVAEVFADVFPKSSVLPHIQEKYRVKAEQVCFVADDLVDLALIKRVGFPVAVANASQEIKKHAGYVTRKAGGRGAVREVAELIIRSQGKWREAMKTYDV
jgi:3-deoxy-D-manno-octulosonate 8-phosphate phosphatase (KDO 8-P phosphatase)